MKFGRNILDRMKMDNQVNFDLDQTSIDKLEHMIYDPFNYRPNREIPCYNLKCNYCLKRQKSAKIIQRFWKKWTQTIPT